MLAALLDFLAALVMFGTGAALNALGWLVF
jgi:hypothetical protein